MSVLLWLSKPFLKRCQEFRKAGADILFLEAPESEAEMVTFCKEVEGPKMANCLAKVTFCVCVFGRCLKCPQGLSPNLSPNRLKEIGYTFAAYPFDILLAFIESAERVFEDLKDLDKPAAEPDPETVKKLWQVTGFDRYMIEQEEYGCQINKQEKGNR